jgi:predicted MPP superfamily phosphohydrolase
MARRKTNYIFAPEPKRRKGPGCLILVLSLILGILVLSLLGNDAINRKTSLQTAKVPIMGLDKAYESFSVLHLSDLHGTTIGTDLETWRGLLYAKRFDAVVLSGDMVGKSGDYVPMLTLIQTLRTLKADLPIYFVAGDEDPAPLLSDYRGTPEVYADWVLAAQGAGAIYLDAPVSQPVGKLNVWFVPEYLYSVDVEGMAGTLANQKTDMEARGVPYEQEGGASYRALLARLDAMDRAAAAIKAMTESDMQIAVSHVPLKVDYVRTALEWAAQEQTFTIRNVDLVMAGHYVGGQWRFLGLGPIYVPDLGWFPGDDGVLGLQRINSVNQYITAGIGASSFYPMPGRLFNSPSAALLSFTARIE